MPSQDSSHLRAIVAANLDRGIRDKKLNNRKVGDKIGKTEHQVWRWRTGRHMPALATMVALADVLFDGDLAEFYVQQEPVAA